MGGGMAALRDVTWLKTGIGALKVKLESEERLI
jgi:hypothetical protein